MENRSGLIPLAVTPGAPARPIALTSSAGSLWKIDIAKASASMIEPDNPPLKACAFAPQFLNDFERSQKPWTRSSPQQN